MRLILAVVSCRTGQLFHGTDAARSITKEFFLVGILEIMWHPRRALPHEKYVSLTRKSIGSQLPVDVAYKSFAVSDVG